MGTISVLIENIQELETEVNEAKANTNEIDFFQAWTWPQCTPFDRKWQADSFGTHADVVSRLEPKLG